MERTKKTPTPSTTAQSLGSLVKSCRDIMRKDKGLNGDLDRLPMLTWVMFLKFLDDMEQVREAEAALEEKRFRPAIEPPYRWRDWAAQPDGITGDALIAFIQNDEATLPDGSKGPGLFAYLRSLTGVNGGDRRDVIRSVFTGTVNRMLNGYLLRDIINKVHTIHFTSSEEISTLGHLYESMLKEMRDAAGDSGEFYTPRPLVKFIVAVVNPQLGETILDPACGTGGFLAESFEYLKKQCKTAEDYRLLQRDTLFGVEAKPLPYLLCQMNLLLHGAEAPNIDPLNALRFPLREIGDKDRVDIILTNPPFGGAEEKGILGNFPEDMQTAETALLFLQLIMRKLKRQGKGSVRGGRAAVVVPDGTLFNKGIAARIKEELVNNFNLHTIVRLPFGVFEPYTPIRSNILFFDTSSSTKETWFYEIQISDERKKYTKTKPIRLEEFADCLSWFGEITTTPNAWYVSREQIAERGFDLDFSNPNTSQVEVTHDPVAVMDLILANQEKISVALDRLRVLLKEFRS
jgi:type I restriction enzyme M protein